MRMSDWSSDVCSSDLRKPGHCGSCAPSGADSARRPGGRSRRHRATGAGRFLHWLPGKLPNQKYQRWVEVACWGKPNTVTTVLAPLDRVVVRWNRAAVPPDNVNPIYFKRVEQIHRVGGSPLAIPSDPDLL